MTKPIVFAGPCGVLPIDQMKREAEFLCQFRDKVELVIRAGAWKGQLYPGKKLVNGEWVTTEQEYVGLGARGVRILELIQDKYKVEACTEVMNSLHMHECCGLHGVKWVQVGTRHMGNLPLLRSLRNWGGNILLKRGAGNTIHEWIGAAEHLLHGADNTNKVTLCERGIVTHEHTDPRIRWRPDLLAVPQIKADYWMKRCRSSYPIIVDVSHSTGRRDLVRPMARAAMACGADGIMVEVMERPDESMTDAAQGIDHRTFEKLVGEITSC